MRETTNLKNVLLISVFLVATTCSIAAGRTIYVEDSAAASGNGQTWATAYKYLQDALTAAVSGDEIPVAEGIYKPDEDSAHPNGTGSRTATFQLINGVTIKGGYAGFGAPDPNARNIVTYQTILSGDLNADDVNDPTDLLDEPSRSENSYHVVTGSGTNKTAVLDGFTIMGGNANVWGGPGIQRDSGGGMYNNFGSPTVTNCTFTTNSSLGVCPSNV